MREPRCDIPPHDIESYSVHCRCKVTIDNVIRDLNSMYTFNHSRTCFNQSVPSESNCQIKI